MIGSLNVNVNYFPIKSSVSVNTNIAVLIGRFTFFVVYILVVIYYGKKNYRWRSVQGNRMSIFSSVYS